jgi:hypothetical protein
VVAYEDDPERQKRMPDTGEFDPETYDEYILAQVQLPRDDELKLGTVIRRAKDGDDNPKGKHNQNPLLDTRIYEVEFSDGQVLEYAANVKILYSQVDEEGHHQVMLDEIVDHKSDKSAMLPDDGYITLNGRRRRRITTKGWKPCVQWKDGSTSWEPLSDMKEAYPVQTDEYAIANKLEHQPAFALWVDTTIRRRDRIIAAATTKRYHKRTHKFGIKIPKTVKEALEIDRRTGTNYWREAFDLEMKKVRVPSMFRMMRRSGWDRFAGMPDMLLMSI